MPIMDSVTGFRFEDSTRLSLQTEMAPVSEHDLLQLQQRAQQGSMGHDVEESQKSHDDCGEKPPTVSKQGARKGPPGAKGIRGITGPRANLYAFAFTEWGVREEERSSHSLGDEERGSPAVASRRGSRRGRGANRRQRPVVALTRDMCATYARRNPLFRFTPNIPRRVLTVPSTAAGNDGLDNEEFNLIARVNDVLEAPTTNYSVLDLLGQGTFGQVFRCQDHTTKDIVAIKVVKNKPAYRNQALLEIQVAKLLNERYDPNNTRNIVRLLDCFQFQNHLCLVFELLSINLFELLKQNQFRGLPLSLIRHFIKQILEALEALQQANVIHCDLKPENVLLMNKTPDGGDASRGVGGSSQRGGANRLKVIDFGSACFEGQTMYSYIQSRFYRSPEVLLGLPYGGAIDIWSLGCITVEIFLGLPIFPGVSDHNQICRIVEMIGDLPEFILENGKDTLKFFKKVKVPVSEGCSGAGERGARGWRAGADMAVSPDRDFDEGGRERGSGRGRSRGYRHVLKTPEEYARDTGTAVPQLKKYFKHSSIPDIIQSYPLPGGSHRRGGGGSSIDTAQEKEARRVFTHFVLGLLNPHPWKRWTPKQASSHPFITGQPHPRDLGALTIADDPLTSDRRCRQMHAMQLQQQKDKQEAERKHAQRLRQHRQQQEQQKREQRRGMAIPGASQSRGISALSGVSIAGSGTPGSYQTSPLQHARRSSGDSGLIAMQMARTSQGHRSGADSFGSTSRPIDVPAGGIGGEGLAMQTMFNRDLDGVGGLGGGHDLTARSMGCPTRGATGTSYPPRGVQDDAEFDAGRGEAYSYGAASFSMGGASGNYVASDFGYALQRPGLRYEPTFKQSPPATHSSSHVGSGSLKLQQRRISDVVPGMTHPGSYTSYHQSDSLRSLERGARALSMDQSQGAGTHYYIGVGAGGLSGQLPRNGGRFGHQSRHYGGPAQQAPVSVSASTAGPGGYATLGRGGYAAPPSVFRNDAPQASVPWVRAGGGIGQSQPKSVGPRAHSTSPVFGRLAGELPSDNQDHEVEPNLEDLPHPLDCSLGGGSGDIWPKCVAGVKSEDHSGRARRGRNPGQRGRRQEMRRGPVTDPGVGGDRGSFPFQLDDGRLPAGASGGGLLVDPSVSSPLDWMSGGGTVGMDDPEGVHKRSLNGTSKGIPPTATAMAAIPSPRDDGDLIRRVVCDDAPGVMQHQQQPIQSESLLSQQLMQYKHQNQQGKGQQQSRTPFGTVVQGPPPEKPRSPTPRQHMLDPAYGVGGERLSSGEQAWLTGRNHLAGADDMSSDHSVEMGMGGSAWVSSSSTRALRRRGSSGSSEFYFVDTQQGVGGSSYSQPPMSPAGPSSSRPVYSGRGRTSSASTPSSFGVGLPQHSQGQGQSQQSPMPPRPPRPPENSAVSMDQGSWAGSAGDNNWGSLASPLQTTQQRLPTTPRSLGSRGASLWDERGAHGGGDTMRSIREGNPPSNT